MLSRLPPIAAQLLSLQNRPILCAPEQYRKCGASCRLTLSAWTSSKCHFTEVTQLPVESSSVSEYTVSGLLADSNLQ
jgi:hypothetical protein